MRPFSVVVVLVLVLAPGASAQDIVPDTLDWHGYYPLDVGNAWERVVSGANNWYAARRTEILNDTLVEGTRYVVWQSIFSGIDMDVRIQTTDRGVLGYDNARSRVIMLRASGSAQGLTCDLDVDFGDTFTCDGSLGPIDAVVSGGYAEEGACLAVGSNCAPYAAQKIFSFPLLGTSITYYHGIGEVSSDGLTGTSAYTYVRVAGAEYGERAVFVGSETTPDRVDLELSVYPNPARDRAWLTLPVSTRRQEVTVFDLLGRTVRPGASCDSSPCELNLDGLGPGLYFVRVAEGSRVSGVVPVLVNQ